MLQHNAIPTMVMLKHNLHLAPNSRMISSPFFARMLSLTADAPVLLAQTGTAKTAIGWLIVLLCIGLGLLVVCRPAARNPRKRARSVASRRPLSSSAERSSNVVSM